MNSVLKYPLRTAGRSLWLGAEFVLAGLNWVTYCGFSRRDALSSARARWLQRSARRILRVFRADTEFTGAVPSRGLLVCNHLSYLDILVLAAIIPAVFVAKREVKDWPLLGWFARLAGTIFVDRSKPSQAMQAAAEIKAALRDGALVVLFPEGTSSGGETVLPFKSSLLAPATQLDDPLTAGLIAYELTEGDVREEICYWKDMTLLPHLINLLSKPGIRAQVKFAELRHASTNRKELARQLHGEVLRLKQTEMVAA